MRAALKWMLILSTCASAVALLWPVDAEQEPGAHFAASPIPKAHTAWAVELPEALPFQTLRTTKRDPFESVPVIKPPPVAPVAKVIAPPAEPPRPPPMTYRYLGSFTGPDGAREIYLTMGDRITSVRQGSQLEGGYVVETVSAAAVNVLHAATQTRIDIPITQNKDSP
jgi:hypothetical protein